MLGQLILATILGIFKGFASVIKEKQRAKTKKAATDLIHSLENLNDALSGLKSKLNENAEKGEKKDE